MRGSYSDLNHYLRIELNSELLKWISDLISTSALPGTWSVTLSRQRLTHEPLDCASSISLVCLFNLLIKCKFNNLTFLKTLTTKWMFTQHVLKYGKTHYSVSHIFQLTSTFIFIQSKNIFLFMLSVSKNKYYIHCRGS